MWHELDVILTAPKSIVLVGDRIERLQLGLFPTEAAIVVNAVDKRRAEFEAGRSAARLSLVRLGLEPAPLLRGRFGAPLWPHNVVGSIAHTAVHSAAAAARSDCHEGIGLDLEAAAPLPPDVAALVVRPDEQRASAPASIDARLYGTLLFAAKEALVKCMSPLFDALFELRDFEIDIKRDGRRFGARYRGDGPDRCKQLATIGSGVLGANEQVVVALYWLPPSRAHVREDALLY